jgi:hypothetical protein
VILQRDDPGWSERRILLRVRQRFVAHWWIWLLIGAIAFAGSALLDRYVAGDKGGNPLGYVLVGVVIVGIVFYVSGLVAHRSSKRAE